MKYYGLSPLDITTIEKIIKENYKSLDYLPYNKKCIVSNK